MRKIQLSNGGAAIVDDEDFEYLNRHRWHRNQAGYATRSIAHGKRIFMHREILQRMGIELDNRLSDHKNRDRLDNRRANLRPVTVSESLQNRARYKNNASGYKGVVWDSVNRCWKAQIYKDKKLLFLGLYDIPTEAAIAYDYAARRLYGEFAYVNFPSIARTPKKRCKKKGPHSNLPKV